MRGVELFRESKVYRNGAPCNHFLTEMFVQYITTLAMLLVFAPSVVAHHSDAGINLNTLVTLEGSITEFYWRNPHVYFTMEAADGRGELVEWTVQMGSAITSARRGWTRDSLSAGDRVTVRAFPAEDGQPYGILGRDPGSLVREGEIIFTEPLYAAESTVTTSSLEGTWMTNRSEWPRPTGLFFAAQLRLTEKGTAARAAYNEFSDENPEARCIGRPTPSPIIASNLFALQIGINEEEEIAVIRTEFFDAERIVYMDGRVHPGDRETFPEGHSIGWWDEDTLVVDTENFSNHRSPYQMGVPSGIQKHVVERYRLKKGGTRMVVEFTLEDPEYIAEPLTHTRELIYSPQLELSRYDCDLEAARRFMSQGGG